MIVLDVRSILVVLEIASVVSFGFPMANQLE